MAKAAARYRWLRLVVAYFGTSFLLHFLWEMAQKPLFVLPPAPLMQHLQMCLFATATGDMAFMLTLYLTAAMIHQDILWIRNEAAYRHPATWIVTALVSVLLAISFELWAVHVVHRWEYGSMPIIPVIRVGWTPLLQMLLIPLLTLLVCRWLASAIGLQLGKPDGKNGRSASSEL